MLIGVSGYWVINSASQPRFEITALDTLPGDSNAYELTDWLIWNYDELDENGVEISFPIQITPTYQGNQRFGKVMAIIAGGANCGEEFTDTEKIVLWDDFDKETGTIQIALTLPQVVTLSGLQQNAFPQQDELGLSDRPFNEAKLVIQVAGAVKPDRAWTCQEIVIRNSPWDFRSELVERNGEYEADVIVKNLGGAGEFTVRYRLVRIIDELERDKSTTTNNVQEIASWNYPNDLVHLDNREVFTDTTQLPTDLPLGRYLLETYAIKKQEYVTFKANDPEADWEIANTLPTPWWFGRYPFGSHLFIDWSDAPLEEPVQAEIDRLLGLGIDLGPMVQLVEDVESNHGTLADRYVFENGWVIVQGDKAYALYGPIWEHVVQLDYENLGFPISNIEAVMSDSGMPGQLMEFEGLGGSNPPTVIYSSAAGIGLVEGWIKTVYDENKGHQGWLGYPISDIVYHPDSESQVFQDGYIVYYYPLREDGERDWGHKPIAYRFNATHGKILDIHAGESWQDTGINLEPGSKVTVQQIEGLWTSWVEGDEWFDANGNPRSGSSDERPLPSAQASALVGRIGGESGDVFLVGRSAIIEAAEEGKLELMMNSGSLGDNEGFITVHITTDP